MNPVDPGAYQVFLNPRAGMGRAAARWAALRPVLEARGLPVAVYDDPPEALAARLKAVIGGGAFRVVAAGGDGTLRALAAALMDLPRDLRARATLGMIGLGTSNSYLRPPDPDAWVRPREGPPVPVALDVKGGGPREVYRLTHDGGVEYFLMNSSVGLIARACETFLDPPLVLRLLTRVLGVDATVKLYGAYNALTARPQAAVVRGGGRVEVGEFTGITLLKWASVAGGVVFRTARTVHDGLFDVLCLRPVGAVRLQELLDGWAADGPVDGGEVAFFPAPEVEVEFPAPARVEFDGELVRTQHARYEILPGALRVMGLGAGG